MYSGPFGYGDMDMLGNTLINGVNSRGGKWRSHPRRTTNSLQLMGTL